MKAPRMFTLLSAGMIAAGMLLSVSSSTGLAAPKAPLPGIKSYNFSASPKKLRWLCFRYWKGRYWRKQEFYGCDELKIKMARPYRVVCRRSLTSANIICVVTSALPAGGGGGGSREGGQATRRTGGFIGGPLSARP